MRILLVSKTLTFHRKGGFETHVTELASILAERGHDVGVVCRPLEKKPRVDYEIYDTKYLGIDLDAVDNITSVPFFARKINRIAKNYDIVHGHGVSSLACKGARGKLPFVFTLHGLGEKNLAGYGWMVPLLKIPFDAQRLCLLDADKVICQSKSMMREGPEYYKFSRGKCVYIPSALDAKKFSGPRTGDGNTVGFVGFMHERKGLDRLLHAMRLVRKDAPKAHLVVAGPGDAQKFAGMANSIGIGDSVSFIQGASDSELARLYRSMDVFCLPSQYESFGLAAYEAVAAGTPVVLSKTADFKELSNGIGFSVDPDPRLIADKISLLLHDASVRKRFSNKCHAKIKSFDWKNVIGDIEREYENLI